ncbi:MAG: hypothetical protein NUV67_04720, partial [archaeon]|nr:hypothetical protein [archaeon]
MGKNNHRNTPPPRTKPRPSKRTVEKEIRRRQGRTQREQINEFRNQVLENLAKDAGIQFPKGLSAHLADHGFEDIHSINAFRNTIIECGRIEQFDIHQFIR